MEKELFETVISKIKKYVGRKKGFEKRLKDGLQHIYWGITLEDSINIKILFILNRLVEMAKLGNKITILVADIHTFLDQQRLVGENEISEFKSNINKILDGYNLCKEIREKITIVIGSDFQLNKSYILDLYKLLSINGTIMEYCKDFDLNINEIEFKDVLHPILQSLDEAHLMEIANLEVDCQVGYTNCLNQYVFSKKNMRKLGFKSKTYLLYDIPEILLNQKKSPANKISLNYNETYLIPAINTSKEELIDFVMNTLFDYAIISGVIENKTYKDQIESFKELSLNDKRDTILNIIKNFYIKYLSNPTPS